jgi:hypothetical protein
MTIRQYIVRLLSFVGNRPSVPISTVDEGEAAHHVKNDGCPGRLCEGCETAILKERAQELEELYFQCLSRRY